MKKLLTSLLVLSSSVAMADKADLYIGGAVGLGWADLSNSATSFRLDGGYNFNDFFAIELGTTGMLQPGTGINQSLQTYDLSLKGTLPVGDMFGFFGQIGAGYITPGFPAFSSSVVLSNDILKAGWSTLVALGVQLNMTRQFSINLTDYAYLGAANPQGNINNLLLGVKYDF